MKNINEIAEKLQLVIMPTSDDEVYLSQFDRLTSSVAEYAAKNLSIEQLSELNKLLESYSKEVEGAMSNMTFSAQIGIPKVPKSLTEMIYQLSPIIEKFETEYDIRVEF